ncbi:MAG TPA: TonB-dependent receptor [Kofleriaceae bacterium]|nr:TonB-dependent receptor [Kofleriaceae bacterium]
MATRGLCALLVIAGAGTARADARAEDPVVDVADLPPLPAAAEPAASSATVLAASSASEDVVVGAAKREQSLGNVASAVTVISGDRIRRFGYRTVGEAVAAVAGAYLVDNRLSYSIGIRGLQVLGDFNTRLLVLIDGASVNEAWGAFAGLGYDGFVSVDDISRIEVIRGPVSSFYGTNAFFGTINIVTRGAAETPGVWATTAVNSINGPTVSAGFSAGDVHRGVRGSFHAMDRIGDTTQLDTVSPDTPLKDDASSAIGGGVVGVYDGSFAQVRAYRYTRESPFAPYDSSPTTRPYALHDSQILVEGGHTRELTDRLSVTGRVYGNFYQYDDDAVLKYPAGAPGVITLGTAETYGLELRGRYELLDNGKLGLTAGSEGNINRTVSQAYSDTESGPHESPDDSSDVSDPYTYEVVGTYAELDAQPLTWLGFTGGVRYDIHHDDDTGFRTKVSPRVALFLSEPERYGLKLLYTEGFRAASAFESHFDDGVDFKSNAQIKPEEIASYEAIVWAKPTPGVSLRLSAFQWTIDRLIEQDPDPVFMAQLQFQNEGSLRSQGIEAEASYRDSRGWYAFAGFAYDRVGSSELDGSMGNPDHDFVYGDVPNAPKLTASGGISTPKLFDRVHVSTDVNVIGARQTRPDSDGNSLPESPAWVGWNATLYAPNISGFAITAGVRNILGKRDLVVAPADYDQTLDATGGPLSSVKVIPQVLGEGREFYVKVGYAY